MIVLSAAEPPPVGPWAGLGVAVLSLGCAFVLVQLIQRAYDREQWARWRASSRPRWWRMRVVGYREMTVVPLVFFCLCCGLSMIGYSLLLWTGFHGAAVATVLFGLSAIGCFLWGLYDSFGPHAWKRNGRDEYTLW